MKIFSSVKILLSISMLYSVSNASETRFEIEPHLECGVYRITGYFTKNRQHDFLTVFNKGSSSPHELLVLGGSIKEKLNRINSKITAVVYVPKRIQDNNAPYVILKKFEPFNKEEENLKVLIEKKSCGDKSLSSSDSAHS